MGKSVEIKTMFALSQSVSPKTVLHYKGKADGSTAKEPGRHRLTQVTGSHLGRRETPGPRVTPCIMPCETRHNSMAFLPKVHDLNGTTRKQPHTGPD